MSTPSNNPPTPPNQPTTEFPYQPQIEGFGASSPDVGEDMVAKARATADVSSTVNKMAEGTDALLQTLNTHLDDLKTTAQDLPAVFSTTAEHIKRGADAAEKLAAASDRTAKANKDSAKHLEDGKFSIKGMIDALSHGNIQGVIGEAFQGLPGSGRFRQQQGEMLNRLGSGSLIDRLMGRGTLPGPVTAEGVGPEVPGLLARLGIAGGAAGYAAAASLLTPAGIYGAYRLARQANADQREALQVGQLTGEGRGAGFAALGVDIPFLGHIGGETMGLRGSPFDLIGDKEAEQIVMGVRGAGFRGDEARSLEQSVRGIVNDLGISVQDAMNIAIPAIKEAGMSTQQLSDVMSTMDDTAKNAHTSIGDLTTAVQGLITSTAQFSRSAAGAAPAQLQNLERQFQGTLVARSPAQLAGFLQGTQREMIAQLSGFAPYEAYSKEFTRSFNEHFTIVLVRLAQDKPPTMDWNAYVMMMMQDPTWQQLFGQTPIDDIADLLRRTWRGTNHGRNVGGYVNRQRSKNIQNQANRTNKSVKSLTDDLFRDSILHPGKGIQDGIINVAEAKRFNIVGKVDQTLTHEGYSRAARQSIEKEMRSAIQNDDSKSLRDALKNLGDRIDSVANQLGKKHQVAVTVDPRYGRMLRTLNIPAIEAARGQRAKQGTTDLTP